MAVIPHRGSGPLEWEDDEPHVLIVTAVWPPENQFDNGALEYELEHPSSCKFHWNDNGDEAPYIREWKQYDCAVANIEGDAGFSFALSYSGTPITEPGRYLIKAWGRRIPNWEYGDEYDASVYVVEKQ